MKKEINYYSIIPASLIIDNSIMANAKLLYGIITSLTNIKGQCFASDKYFADVFNVSKVSIQNWLKDLEEHKYITRHIIYKEHSKEIESRFIYINNNLGIQDNFNTPIQDILYTRTQDNLGDNNISFNNKSLAKANEAELQKQVNNSNLDIKEDLDKSISFFDKNKNSRNLKILMEYIAENFISDEVKQSLIEWLEECYAQNKTFTLKHLEKELEYLTSNCSDKDELLDIVYKTTQSKWATFRYMVENRDKQKQFNQKNNKQAVRTTEQKICGEFMAL